MHGSLLLDVIIVLALAIGVIFCFVRFNIPGLVGFILTGILAGPSGLGLISAAEEVETIAELGVVLLLFTIGIEFSLTRLKQMRHAMLTAGTAQLFGTAIIVTLACLPLGLPWRTAIFVGMLVSLSSTAIAIKFLEDRLEIDTAHGRTSLAVLIYQDLAVVFMMIVTPLLAGHGAPQGNPWLLPAKGLSFIALLFVCWRWVVPWMLTQVARTRSRELFLFTVILICLFIAWLTSTFGLSLALGAFLAGVIIAESEYSMEALGRIVPLKDVFTGLFFISVGMLLDVGFLVAHLPLVLLLAAAVMLIKGLCSYGAVWLSGYPLLPSLMVAILLCQVGEFSFILAGEGVQLGLLSAWQYQVFLAVTLITMGVSPFFMAASPALTAHAEALPLPSLIRQGRRHREQSAGATNKRTRDGHLVIVGYGVSGRNVASAAASAGIEFVVVEMNPETVRQEQAKDEPVFFGDASQETILQHLDIEQAHMIVVTIPDAAATRRIVSNTRRLNPDIHIAVRTRFVKEVPALLDLGADEVIPGEFEISIELLSRMLSRFLVPAEDIERLSAELRADGYRMIRSAHFDATTFADTSLGLPDFRVTTLRLHRHSQLAGKPLKDSALRSQHRVNVLAIRHEGTLRVNPGGEDVLYAGDELIVAGEPTHLINVRSYCGGSRAPGS